MSAANGGEASDPNAERSTVFRKRRRYAPAQTQDQSRRQAELVQIAWRHFGDAAPMIAFLNTHHEQLEARPLMLAIKSDDGLACVERAIKDLEHNTQELGDAK